MASPNSPTLEKPKNKPIEYIVLAFDDPLSIRHNIHLNPQVRPIVISGVEVDDFTEGDYVLFRARLDEIETSRGTYKKEEERGIKFGTGEPGVQLKYRRIKTIDVPLKNLDLARVSSL